MKLERTESGVSIDLSMDEFVDLMDLEDRTGQTLGPMIGWARENTKAEVTEVISRNWDGRGPPWWED